MSMDERVIALTDLTKQYGRFTAVDRICLTIRKGEIFGLLGPNGAGKTTLLRQIARELSGMQRRACVVDERCEIFPPGGSEKMPPLDLL